MQDREALMRVRLFLLLLFLPAVAFAEPTTVEVLPPNPVAGQNVFLRITDTAVCGDAVAVRSGTHFTVTASICPFESLQPELADLGTLEAGTYTYSIHIGSATNPASASGSFTVAAALPIVPALSDVALLALAVMLAGIGLFVARRG